MYLVLCVTGHGKRYHVFTDVPESYYEDRVYQFGPMEDPDGAVASGYYLPERWDEEGNAEAASGDDHDSYVKQRERFFAEEAEQTFYEEEA